MRWRMTIIESTPMVMSAGTDACLLLFRFMWIHSPMDWIGIHVLKCRSDIESSNKIPNLIPLSSHSRNKKRYWKTLRSSATACKCVQN